MLTANNRLVYDRARTAWKPLERWQRHKHCTLVLGYAEKEGGNGFISSCERFHRHVSLWNRWSLWKHLMKVSRSHAFTLHFNVVLAFVNSGKQNRKENVCTRLTQRTVQALQHCTQVTWSLFEQECQAVLAAVIAMINLHCSDTLSINGDWTTLYSCQLIFATCTHCSFSASINFYSADFTVQSRMNVADDNHKCMGQGVIGAAPPPQAP